MLCRPVCQPLRGITRRRPRTTAKCTFITSASWKDASSWTVKVGTGENLWSSGLTYSRLTTEKDMTATVLTLLSVFSLASPVVSDSVSTTFSCCWCCFVWLRLLRGAWRTLLIVCLFVCLCVCVCVCVCAMHVCPLNCRSVYAMIAVYFSCPVHTARPDATHPLHIF